MSYRFAFYPTPLDAICELISDDGFSGVGVPYTDPATGRPGQSIEVDDDVVSEHGATLYLEAEGYLPMQLRGFLILVGTTARLQCDDFIMTEVETEPPPPEPPPSTEPDPNADPLQIIHQIYNSTNPNLATASGCGLFVEDVTKELHEKMNPGWGHVKKNPGQNQFNGHAVDAIHLLVPSGGTAPGIYDIIQDSASANAKPVFNYAGPPDNNLWYYPAAPISSGQDMRSITTWHVGKK